VQPVFLLGKKINQEHPYIPDLKDGALQTSLVKSKSNAAIANICKPAVERWQKRYKSAIDAYKQAREIFERTKKTADAVLIANAENSFKECKKEKDALEIFKKDLGTLL